MNRRGFTLIELMVVLAILGLLAGIGIPQYTATLERAREAADKAALATLQSAVKTFMAETTWTPTITAPATTATFALGATGTSIWDSTKTIPFTDYWKDATLPAPESKVNNGKVIKIDASGNLTWG